MLKRATVTGIVLFSLLGTPNRSEAGLLEFIWDMSGPQMFNVGFGCNFYRGAPKKADCGVKIPLLGASPLLVKETLRDEVFKQRQRIPGATLPTSAQLEAAV